MSRNNLREKASLTAASLFVMSMISSLVITAVPAASAQTQYVTASPGLINLGMTTSVSVTAPAVGTYTVVVQKPDSSTTQVTLTFTTVGQTQSATYGASNSGFNVLVDKPGTYNVFLEQGSTVVSSTSFYVTNQLLMGRFDAVNGGTCAYVESITRGSKIMPRFFVQYASNNAWVTNATMKVVTFTFPDGTLANATWHAPAAAAENIGFFIGKVFPSWNATYTTPNWKPTATAKDIYGNVLQWTYVGRPFAILPAPLTTSVQLIDSKSGQFVAGLASGQSMNVTATVAYTAASVSGTEIVAGFLGPLDTTRGGQVTGQLGWGFYNTTSNSFGSSKNPGGLVSALSFTYTGSKGIWNAPVTLGTLPPLPDKTTTYLVIVNAKDGLPTPNTGAATVPVPAATVQTITSTATTVSTTTAVSVTTAISTSVSTATSTSTATSVSTVTTAQSGVQSTTQSGQGTNEAATSNTWLYGAIAAVLVVGFAVGFIVRRPRKAA